MKKVLPLLLTVGTTLGTTLAIAGPANGSFESGALNGWRLGISQGSSLQSRHRPAGSVSLTASWQPPSGLSFLPAPVEGNKFVTLGTLASGNFTGNRSYNLNLSQELFLRQGDTVSGWSAFFNGDFTAQDSAWVKLQDCDGALLATPWLEHSGSRPECDFNSTPYQSATPWTQWSWQAPETGPYTLSLGMTTSGDNNYASYGFFDHIFVVPMNTPVPVPEPASLTLVALGAALVMGLRRKRN